MFELFARPVSGPAPMSAPTLPSEPPPRFSPPGFSPTRPAGSTPAHPAGSGTDPLSGSPPTLLSGPVAVSLRVAVVGAGPVGLDAALACRDNGWDVTVYEAAEQVGGHVREWGHARMFTPWELNVSPRMWAHLVTAGWRVADGERYPTGQEFAEHVLDAVAALPALAGRIRLATRVEQVARDGLLKHEQVGSEVRRSRPFRLLVVGPDGAERIDRADVVLDCSGNLGNPNAIGDGGIPAPGERALGARIRRTLPDLTRERDRWAGRHVLLVGAGASAQTAARDLAELARDEPATRVLWAVRAPEPDWGAVPGDALPGRQALVDAARRLAAGVDPAVRVRTGTVVAGLTAHGDRVRVDLTDRRGHTEHVEVDRVLGLTGYMPSTDMYRHLQVHECYATAAPIRLAAALLGDPGRDRPRQHPHSLDTLRSPEPDFFILGVKSYGRDSRFLLPVGYDQVDLVTSAYVPFR